MSTVGGWERLAIGLDWRESKALVHFGLHKDGGALVSAVGVLLVDGSVVLLGALTALDDHRYEGAKLGPGVSGVVNVGMSLPEG